MLQYLKFPVISLVFGLGLAGLLSWLQNPNLITVLEAILTVLLLCVLEISLSFDNAVVNATIIRRMDHIWRKRFLFWGMLIAVFGMRLLFPVLIVALAGNLSIVDAFMLAIKEPKLYSQMMSEAHLAVSSFGGTFLLMVALNFFLDSNKETHWISVIEKTFGKLAKINGAGFIFALIVILVIYSNLDFDSQATFIKSALYGLLTFLCVHGLSELLGDEDLKSVKWLSTGMGLFLYLEVLDASFSFDGVIGAFAITTQIYEIMIGLGVGAFFVRGLTLYLVEHEKLEQYEFLEHGAFYALFVLAFFMLLDHFFHFKEWITALSGAAILILSILYSIYSEKKKAE
ncbi:MAG: DUF475 domain-containing protein [Bdellovibrio sp.]|nr:DUF475 domain-containing protein [Bdellovibrio sp.]